MLIEFVLLELIKLEQCAAAKQQQQQVYECCSSRVLLECRRVLLLLLLMMMMSGRVPVTAWPRRARDCLVLAALVQLGNRGPVPISFAVQ